MNEEKAISGPEFYQKPVSRENELNPVDKQLLLTLVRDGKLDSSLAISLEPQIIQNGLKNVLLDQNHIQSDDFKFALLDLYRRDRITLFEISERFNIEASDFLRDVAKHFKLEYCDLDSASLDYALAEKIPVFQLRKLGALPIKEDEINVYVAFKNPFDLDSQDRIGHIFNRKLLKVVVCDPASIDKYMSKIELNESIKGIISEIRKDLGSSSTAESDSSGILKLIETILRTAIQNRASDIHIEPAENNCIVRSRIDGMLTESFVFDKDIYPPLVSRIKLLSNMDIAERRKPQDGRFSAQILNKEYDFRISTLPILNGESIVLRILDKSKVIISLENLGMHPDNFSKFKNAMHQPYGIILVTGPTGSGKTTTLYGALNDIKSVEKKIITVEDPVEYQLNLIQQVHVNEKAGLTFSLALRSILRQDPDIIMIGEIRDQETLRIAVQAALTGHLVFSTLHTNDAISAITRIIDMGIESYLVSGALVAIEAQRLVRRLCPHCKQKTVLPENTLNSIKKYLPQNYEFYKSVGCEECSQTGFLGREMISEILPISDHISSKIAVGASKEELKKIAYEEGFIDMFSDGIIRAARGITTIEEVYRVAKT
ncbi:transformation system, type II secretion system ATPase CtsE [Campylobacter iguaniorum]|uniref:Transformation system, type II secretion system ATPase CtsE n=1 Tax=Campylobacter iguaniorum TaxID=1244531 RepID=A0A076FG08_9BACT|nr:GspE/PulE family protein [Campylobacter iguaniorum]AII14754.1 transformation system, type II secretion system ATPase CtsE [Campylobacter iguaniorum]ALV24489.1 transformation system, type II secretion system ATPase CtsE [Campylobacter iguaniorum]